MSDADESQKTTRTLATRAERSLKEVDRMLKASPNGDPAQRASIQLEQAKVFALLNLADAIRESRGG